MERLEDDAGPVPMQHQLEVVLSKLEEAQSIGRTYRQVLAQMKAERSRVGSKVRLMRRMGGQAGQVHPRSLNTKKEATRHA